MSRTIVIGDVHGCIVEFKRLYELLDPSTDDKVVQVGDLMDKGPDPIACVRFAREKNMTVVLSNHEDKHRRWRMHHTITLESGKKNPVNLNSLEISQNLQLTDEEIQWISSLQLYYKIRENLVVVHAGLEPAYSFANQSIRVKNVRYVGPDGKMISLKNVPKTEDFSFWSEVWKGPESVIYGHAAFNEIKISSFPGGACYGIDTGCVYGNFLSAAILENGSISFEQVKAEQKYAKLHVY